MVGVKVPPSKETLNQLDCTELNAIDGASPPDEAELAESQALQQWLDGAEPGKLSPDVKVGVGLMYLAVRGELRSSSQSRIERNLETLATQRAEVSPGTGDVRAFVVWWRTQWLWATAAAVGSGLAAVLVYLNFSDPSATQLPGTAANVPQPGVGLLTAQAAWLASDAARPEFESNMQSYRSSMLAAVGPQ